MEVTETVSYWKIKYNPDIDLLDPELAQLRARIDTLNDALTRIPLSAQQCADLNRLQIIHQVRGTTGIEGNTLSEEAVEAVIRKQTPQDEEERETLNAYKALHFIMSRKDEAGGCAVSEQLIKQLHAIITEGSSQNDNVPGQYRLQKIKVGHNFEGERFEQIPEQMRAFIGFINSDEAKQWGELIRAVIAHFFLVTIHPFSDGNGRTSRMVEDYILFNSEYNKAGFFSLSNFYYKNRETYFAQLDEARFKHNGNLQAFVKFSMGGFYSEIQAIFEKVMQQYSRISFANLVEEKLRAGEISQRQHALLSLMQKFDLKIEESALLKRTDILAKSIFANVKSERTIRRDIDELKSLRLLSSSKKVLSVNYDGVRENIETNPDALFQPLGTGKV